MRSAPSGMQGETTQDGEFQLVTWYRSPNHPQQMHIKKFPEADVIATLQDLLTSESYNEAGEFCLALLNHQGKPVVVSRKGFQADWRRPYVSTELGAVLPGWEAACYLAKPAAASLGAAAARWKLGLIVLTVLAAAAVGGSLLWLEARRRLLEARQKADFVSQVSHELRTPLTSIRMFSDLLARETPVADPAKFKRYALIISEEAGRLSRLINRVLDFSRLERGQLPMGMAPCELQHLVAETLERIRPQLEKQGFSVSVSQTNENISLMLDEDRISQVLVNLLGNAEKYSGSGREIEVTTTRESASVRVTVSDRGPGVPKGRENRIFEKFYRAHDDLDQGIPGSGLGLALARQIARAHGGDLTYQARKGGGSDFILTLPEACNG